MEEKLFTYDGPAYDPIKQKNLGWFHVSMQAISEDQALSRIQFNIKKKLGLDPRKSKIRLNKNCLSVEEFSDVTDNNEKTEVSSKICPVCGTKLLDNGDCPKCNETEYPDYFEENLGKKKKSAKRKVFYFKK